MMVKQNCTESEKKDRALRIIQADIVAKNEAREQSQRSTVRSTGAGAGAGAGASDDVVRYFPNAIDLTDEDFDEDFEDLFGDDEWMDVSDDDVGPVGPVAVAAPIVAPFVVSAALAVAPAPAPAAAAAAPIALAAGGGPVIDVPIAAPVPIVAAVPYPSRAIGARTYSIDQSPHSRSKCHTCHTIIAQRELRIKEHMASRDWYFHLQCFVDSHLPHFLEGKLLGLDQLPADIQDQAKFLME